MVQLWLAVRGEPVAACLSVGTYITLACSMSLLLLLNPKQYGGVTETKDTSDILDVYRRRRRKREDELLEEELAAQLLKKRQKDIVIPQEINKIKLANVLQDKLFDTPKADEVAGKERVKRVRLLMMVLILDEYE